MAQCAHESVTCTLRWAGQQLFLVVHTVGGMAAERRPARAVGLLSRAAVCRLSGSIVWPCRCRQSPPNAQSPPKKFTRPQTLRHRSTPHTSTSHLTPNTRVPPLHAALHNKHRKSCTPQPAASPAAPLPDCRPPSSPANGSPALSRLSAPPPLLAIASHNPDFSEQCSSWQSYAPRFTPLLRL